MVTKVRVRDDINLRLNVDGRSYEVEILPTDTREVVSWKLSRLSNEMTDGTATRDEAIQWCKDNRADFMHVLIPTPLGWRWKRSINVLHLVHAAGELDAIKPRDLTQ